MMQIWIVWSRQPLASFSSEERARQYIASQPHAEKLRCIATALNPDSFGTVDAMATQTTRTARTASRLNH